MTTPTYVLPSRMNILNEMISKKYLRREHDLKTCREKTLEIYGEIEEEWFRMLRSCVVYDLYYVSAKHLAKHMGGRWGKRFKTERERDKFFKRNWLARAKQRGYLRHAKELFTLLQHKAPAQKVLEHLRAFNPPGKMGNQAPGWKTQERINQWMHTLSHLAAQESLLKSYAETNDMLGEYVKTLIDREEEKEQEKQLLPIYRPARSLTRKQEKRKRRRVKEEEEGGIGNARDQTIAPPIVCTEEGHGHGKNMAWDPKEAMHVCKLCGNCYEDRVQDSLMDTHYYTGMSAVKKVDYQEVVYFKTWLKSVEGQTKKTPPPQVITAMKRMCREYGLHYKEQVTPHRIRKFLQEWHPKKGPQYYMNVPYIISQITKEPCYQLTDEQRANCIRRFQMVLSAYNDPSCPRKNTSSGDKRTSCPGYAYTTKKILQLEGLDHVARMICLFDQRDNIFQHDIMWRFICEKNGGAEHGWPFIQTI